MTIAVITCRDFPRDSRGKPTSSKEILMISHGVDVDNLNNVCLEPMPLDIAVAKGVVVHHPYHGLILKETSHA